uniref:Uncharacterized protein n=1 Tax=Panagrolaimus sp. JU765 TaxID=591449 RepID=A0AC34PYF5_9BILA
MFGRRGFCSTFFFVICQAVSNNFCDYYLELENQVFCGENGYLVRYGYPYCSRFTSPEYYDLFDEPGQKWVDCTAKCLLVKTRQIVEKEVGKAGVNCEKIEVEAFEVHTECYRECNFCQICRTNKFALISVFDPVDLFYPKTLNQVYEIGTMCGFQCFF